MKKKTGFVITKDEVYWTVGGKRITPKQAELLQKRLDEEELDNLLGKDFKDNGQKEKTTDALWAIADDMRKEKEDGKFPTYRKAYEWASENLSKDDVLITPQNLERAWHKAKSEGKV
tara:strand:- start:107 stop:457 length:351 start_codon:yes stop_codon:yes gene_type:complete